ncbi:MAG: DUF1080 domain-containing protein [Ferruginibacter sp.]|nr:DUF1080 domain-containing protein [Cytophagales bacterium]
MLPSAFIFQRRSRHVVAGCLLSALVLLSQYGCRERKNGDSNQTAGIGAAEDVTRPAAPMNTLTDQERDDGWVLLFDGTGTSAWRGYNQTTFPGSGWVAKDGQLMMEATGREEEGYGGDIITKDQYENFEFKVDFKLSPDANGGILYSIKEEKGKPVWHNASEYQLLDNEGYEKKNKYVMDKHRTGDNFDLLPSTANNLKPAGEWNQAMLRVKDGQVQHWLNGQKVLEYTLWTPEWKAAVKKSKFAEYPGYGMAKKGHVGLQDWGYQIWYRNIKLRTI